jgi:hypothetical protein
MLSALCLPVRQLGTSDSSLGWKGDWSMKWTFPPSSTIVKNVLIFIPIRPYIVMSWCLGIELIIFTFVLFFNHFVLENNNLAL